jgi:4-diphosphocytidyl-2-C-methyl-D-erythritol kinase
VRIKSFAKVNLGLEVLGLRPDGYHDLRTLFQSVSLADELALFPEDGGQIVLRGNDPSIPWDESNLVFRAARSLQKRSSCASGARIEVTKAVPAGKGLAGGSSNAAMTLLGLNRLWGLGLGLEELTDTGRGLGADVPYFLRGGLCLGLDRGDRLTALEDLPVLPLVIALPPFSCSTADIYREHRRALLAGEASPLPGQARSVKGRRGEGTGLSGDAHDLPPGCSGGKEGPASDATLTSAVEDSKIERFFGSRQLRFLENSLESTVFRFHPRLQDLKALFRSRGAELSLVTGSGSAVFGLFRDRRRAAEAKRAVEKEYPAVLAETVPRDRYERDIWAGV